MQTSLVILTAIAALAIAPAAQANANDTGDGLLWKCEREGAPSHREIADAFGFDNYWFARNLQPTLYVELRRMCRDHTNAIVQVAPRRDWRGGSSSWRPNRG
jgi:hypothetical protein